MNVGTDRAAALNQAWQNARTDGKPRYVWLWNGVYCVEHQPPKAAWAGVLPENVIVVSPEGTYSTLTEKLGDKHVDRQADPA